MIAGGVRAGANHACQPASNLNPGNPASAMVGTSGNDDTRVSPVKPKARTRPDLTCGATGIGDGKLSCVSPLTRALRAGPPPL